MTRDQTNRADSRSMRASQTLAVTAACAALACLVASVVVVASGEPVRAQSPSDVLHQRTIHVEGPFGEPESVLVMYPRLRNRAPHPEGHRWPIVVALHGLGEARLGPNRGFLGWSEDYRLPRAYEAMLWGQPLLLSHFAGFVRREHLARVNAWLATRAFEGVAVVMPYTPSILAPEKAAERERYATWLAGPMLAAVREAYPGFSRTQAGTGIDGISLGGRLSLEAGFRHPEAFAAVGGMQPAVRGDAAFLSGLVRPEAGQHIRLLSSDGDNFLEATRQLGQSLRTRSIPHDLLVVPGPHDYPFNRGPASIELLRFAQTSLHPEAVVDESPAP